MLEWGRLFSVLGTGQPAAQVFGLPHPEVSLVQLVVQGQCGLACHPWLAVTTRNGWRGDIQNLGENLAKMILGQQAQEVAERDGIGLL